MHTVFWFWATALIPPDQSVLASFAQLDPILNTQKNPKVSIVNVNLLSNLDNKPIIENRLIPYLSECKILSCVTHQTSVLVS
jgi:hypothetical protein